MSAFTPGPWRVHQHEHIAGELWLSIGHFTHDGAATPEGRWIGPVAELKYLVAREDEQWANARLIAAAPDLLAALKALVDSYNHPTMDDPDALARAAKAIQQAEGSAHE